MTPTERKEMLDLTERLTTMPASEAVRGLEDWKIIMRVLRLAAEPVAGAPTRFEIVTALKAANKNFMATGSDRESDERYDDMADSMSNLFRVSKHRSGE